MVEIQDWKYPVINCEATDTGLRAIVQSERLGRAVELFVTVPPDEMTDADKRHAAILAALAQWEHTQHEARSWATK